MCLCPKKIREPPFRDGNLRETTSWLILGNIHLAGLAQREPTKIAELEIVDVAVDQDSVRPQNDHG